MGFDVETVCNELRRMELRIYRIRLPKKQKDGLRRYWESVGWQTNVSRWIGINKMSEYIDANIVRKAV